MRLQFISKVQIDVTEWDCSDSFGLSDSCGRRGNGTNSAALQRSALVQCNTDGLKFEVTAVVLRTSA